MLFVLLLLAGAARAITPREKLSKIIGDVQRLIAAAERKSAKPDPAELAPMVDRFLDHAAEHRGDAAGFEGLKNALDFAHFLDDDRLRVYYAEGMDAALADHLDSPRMGRFVAWMRVPVPVVATMAASYLEEIEASTANDSMRCACAWVRSMQRYDAAGATDEAAKVLVAELGMLRDKHGELPQFSGRTWKEALEQEIRPFVIAGTTAPEIEGVDLEGVHFKLSDYRGRVVLLDFWGFW